MPPATERAIERWAENGTEARLERWIAGGDDRQAWARRAREARGHFPASYAWAAAEHERIVARLPDFGELPPKVQGRQYDAEISHTPGPVRRLLHRMRQGRLSPENVAGVVRSLNEVETVLAYLNAGSPP